MDKEIALAKARSLTGFADDVRTLEDVREVLKKLANGDPDIMEAYANNTHLFAAARKIAREELDKLRTTAPGPV